MYAVDIDIGSSSSKAVVLQDGVKVAAAVVVSAGTGTNGPKRLLAQIQEQSGPSPADMTFIFSTGYGRSLLAVVDLQVNEIPCHAKGMFFRSPATRTIIDIGGQDIKAISLDSQGNTHQFYINDKCAARAGRFLEVMSRALEVKLGEMAEYHFRSKHPASVSSTCTVFAESEVISLLSQDRSKEDIIVGVHHSVAAKARALTQRVDIENEVVLCGGMALSRGATDAIQTGLGERLAIAHSSQLTGALGAARLACEEAKRRGKSA